MQRLADADSVLAWALFKADPGAPEEPDPVDWQSYFLPRAAKILAECKARGFELVADDAVHASPSPEPGPSPGLAAIAAGILSASWAAACSVLPKPLRAALMSRLPVPPQPDDRPAAGKRRRPGMTRR
jgi:hypothetical protein